MSDYRDNRRWFLREGPPEYPYVEVTRNEWLQAEWDAGFRGGQAGEPSTEGFEVGGVKGVIIYGKEGVPAGAVELTEEPPQVTYEWGARRRNATMVWEHFSDSRGDAEELAREHVDRLNRQYGPGSATLVRARIERYGWEEVQ